MADCDCSCTCSSGPVLVLPCSGGSNVGQITNSAAIELDMQGKARMYCLVGIAAHISGMVDSAKTASGVIALDGCQVACARHVLEHIGIPITQHLIVTDLGIKKNHNFSYTSAEISSVLDSLQTPT